MENNRTLTNKRKAIAIYKWTLKKNRPFSIAYWILLSLTFPLVEVFMMISYNANDGFSRYVDNMRDGISYIPTTAFALVAVIFSVFFTVMAFSYMHNKRSVDFFGSFPVSRRTLFFSRYLATITSCIIPIIVVGITGGILSCSDTAFLETIKVIAMLIVFIIGNISFLAFISLCCGTVADIFVSYLIINLIYPICIALCYYIPSTILPGLKVSELPAAVYTMLCPIAAFFTAFFATGTMLNIIWWLLLSAVLAAGCYVMSRKRKAETAQNTFASTVIEIVIKFVTCFTAGLGVGYALTYLAYDSIIGQYIWFAAGFIGACMLVNTLLHMIYHRGLSKYKKSMVECGAVIVTGGIFMLVILSGAFGYDTRMPERNDIEAVCIKTEYDPEFVIDGKDIFDKYTKYTENIDKLMSIHESIIERETTRLKHHGLYGFNNLSTNIDYNYSTENNVIIKYKLRNGKIFTRYYYDVYNHHEYKKDIKQLRKESVYLDDTAILSLIPTKYIASLEIGITDDLEDWTMSYWVDGVKEEKENINKLVEALKKDIKEYGPVKSEKKKDTYIVGIEYRQYSSNNDYADCQIVIPEEYKNTMEFLKQLGYGNIEWNYFKDEGEASEFKDYEYTLSDKTIYFEMPKDWDSSLPVYAMPEAAYKDGYSNYLFTPENKLTECEKVTDRIWKYTLPEIPDNVDSTLKQPGWKISRIMFYQHSKLNMNYTGFISVSKKHNFLILEGYRHNNTDCAYAWDAPVYDYNWIDLAE